MTNRPPWRSVSGFLDYEYQNLIRHPFSLERGITPARMVGFGIASDLDRLQSEPQRESMERSIGYAVEKYYKRTSLILCDQIIVIIKIALNCVASVNQHAGDLV